MPPRRRVATASALLLLLFVVLVARPAPARAASPPSPSGTALIAELGSSTPALRGEAAAAAAIEATSPADALDAARQAMQAGAAEQRLRDTVRHEQAAIYQLAADPGLAGQVEGTLGSRAPAGLPQVLAALQALWTLTGQTDPSPLDARPYDGADPLGTLLGFYQGAAQGEGLDWGYLAAINYIESDFGRNPNVSSAGAEGPMQFLPSTWALYGEGGNILDPHDAIYTAARYLRAMGAPGDYPLAVRRYNDDADYVAAVSDLAAAIGIDNLWLDRLYYWSTYG